jgi:Common central domain of tyrosinase/Polyphenol oxidase middle domain
MPMTLSRRVFSCGAAAIAAATLVPIRPRAQGIVHARQSIAALARDNNSLIESYRRAVEVMMARPVTDKTSWQFQANMVGAVPNEVTAEMQPLATYWRQNPRKSYFFLAWQRMHLHFFERIARRASGDPGFALPYWAYDDPAQLALPEPFRPGSDQIETPVSKRRNALARARRHGAFERGAHTLRDMSKDFAAALALDHFTAIDLLDPRSSFGGVRVANVKEFASPGAIEALHNRFHLSIGREGDLASPSTAARDPVYWLHAANIDRMWVKWAARGGGTPDDDGWMKTRFTFVDENGDDRVMTGADVVDTQFQLGYRYDDDPPRDRRLEARASASAPAPMEPLVLARAADVDLSARETAVVLAPVPPPRRSRPKSKSKGTKRAPASAPRTLVVLRDVTAPDRGSVYELFLVLEGPNVFAPTTTSQRIGALELFGGTGREGSQVRQETLAYDASEALAKLARVRGFHMRRLRLSIVRQPVIDAAGVKTVPSDPIPPEIGAIELVRS